MVNVDTKLLVIFTELLSKRNATYVAEKNAHDGPRGVPFAGPAA